MANCATCDHNLNPQGGHCYMFEREPEDCRRHTQGLSAGAIGSVPKVIRNLRAACDAALGEGEEKCQS